MARSKKQTQKEVAAQEVAIDKAYDKAVKEGLPEGTTIATPCDTCPGYESCRDCDYWQKQNPPKKEEVPMTNTIILIPFVDPTTGKGFAYKPGAMKRKIAPDGQTIVYDMPYGVQEATPHLQTIWVRKDNGNKVVIRTSVTPKVSKNGNSYTDIMNFVKNLLAQNHIARPIYTMDMITKNNLPIDKLDRYIDLNTEMGYYAALALILKHRNIGYNFTMNKQFYNPCAPAPYEAEIKDDEAAL